jgi:hypothetical protein
MDFRSADLIRFIRAIRGEKELAVRRAGQSRPRFGFAG